jgi:hypothetical protein
MTTSGRWSAGGGASQDPLFTLSPEASLVSPSATPASASAKTTSAGYGRPSSQSFATYDPATRSWRTSQLCLDGEPALYSETWPRSGTTRSGTAFRRPPSAPLTSVTGGLRWPTPVHKPGGGSVLDGGSNSRKAAARRGLLPTPRAAAKRTSRRAIDESRSAPSIEQAVELEAGILPRELESLDAAPESWRRLWPTPTARLGNDKRGMPSPALAADRYAAGRRNLDDAVTLWPTPTASRRDGLQSHGRNVITGQLNPTWVEWLMGFPLGWTDLEASETPSSPRSPSTSDA